VCCLFAGGSPAVTWQINNNWVWELRVRSTFPHKLARIMPPRNDCMLTDPRTDVSLEKI